MSIVNILLDALKRPFGQKVSIVDPLTGGDEPTADPQKQTSVSRVEVNPPTTPEPPEIPTSHQQLPPISPPSTNPPDDAGLTSDMSPSGTKSHVLNGREYQRLELPRPLYALLIGIDRYKNHKKLNGAAKDVNSIADFLDRCLAVPKSHITKLLNQDATQKAIIQEIRELLFDKRINRGDAILVYFAGHGARATAPPGWATPDGKIETICPFDMSTDKGGTDSVSGIPDVVLNALITELADEKGQNITVIFDCCHSANGLRGDREETRGIDNPPPVSANWQDVPGLRTPKSGQSSDLKSLECAVFLAACGRDQEAGEDEQGGLFTQRLLESISKMSSDNLKELTYRDLIRNLSITKRQHPQCEGSRPHRYLFREEVTSQSFISGYKNKKGNLILDAGEVHGINIGTQFEIYSKRLLSPDNQPRGRLIVNSIFPEEATLSFVNGATFEVPPEFFTIQAAFGEGSKIKVYCSDIKQLNEALRNHQREFSDFVALVDRGDNADLIVSFTDCQEEDKCRECPKSKHQVINFDWADPNFIAPPSNARIGQPIPVSNLDKIAQVFRVAARFRYYFYHGDNDLGQIHVALYPLETKRVKIGDRFVNKKTPNGENLLMNGQAEVRLKADKAIGPFGLTISNHTDQDLFPEVFWFECRSLAIESWYASQHGGGAKKTIDAPLRASTNYEDPSKFDIGHGEVSHKAWGFSYDSKGDAVGFFKVSFATINVNSGFIVQKSPFGDVNWREGGEYVEEAPEWWATQRVKVVQLAP